MNGIKYKRAWCKEFFPFALPSLLLSMRNRLHQTLNPPTPLSWTSQLPKFARNKFLLFINYPISDILL
jgi:hypothetical protein